MNTNAIPRPAYYEQLTPDNCAMLLIDHQAGLFLGVKSIDQQILKNNVIGLAKTAAEFNKIFEHHTVECNGVNIHYVIGGQGKPVLLWHGFLETWYCWRKIMPALAEKYTVIAPDMRGYGDSDKPETGYDGLTLAEDFRALIKHLGFDKIAIAAHDMGAPPALIYAGKYSNEVEALVYLDEPVLLSETIEQILKFSPETMEGGGLWWWVFALAPKMPEILIANHEREFLTWFYDQYLYDRSSIDEETVNEYLRTFATPDGIKGSLGVYRAIFETIQQTEPMAETKIDTPVLCLGGEQSLGENTKKMLQQVANNVRGGAIANCGHFIPDEQPEKLLEQLFTFFEQEY